MKDKKVGNISRRFLILFGVSGALQGWMSPASAQLVDLGAARDFAVLAGSTVTNTGPTELYGDLGLVPGTSVTGFPPGIFVDGGMHVNDFNAIDAMADANLAYTTLSLLPLTLDLTGQDLGGMTLTPGVYRFDSSAQLTGNLILDGQGLAEPRFVFQIGSTLTTASASNITGINGADSEEVYFQVGSSVTLGTDSIFTGTIIALSSNTLTTGVNVEGRVISLTGAVTLDTNNISAIPESSSSLLFLVGAFSVCIHRKRK